MSGFLTNQVPSLFADKAHWVRYATSRADDCLTATQESEHHAQLWGMQVISTKKRNRIIRTQAVDAVKEHRLNLLKERHARQLRQVERVMP